MGVFPKRDSQRLELFGGTISGTPPAVRHLKPAAAQLYMNKPKQGRFRGSVWSFPKSGGVETRLFHDTRLLDFFAASHLEQETTQHLEANHFNLH